MKQPVKFMVIIGLMVLTCFTDVYSCTVFRLKAKDGSMIVTRSMEFSVDLHYDFIVVPRNKGYASPFAPGINGLKWITRYGYVGVASFGRDYGISDGMNEKGLAVGVLWYETDMKWQDVTPADSSVALAQSIFCDWILGSYATVDELRSAMPMVKVFNYVDPTAGMAPTLHFIVYDASGGCIVVEFDNGECHIYDNPLGIMTNAPSFPWQVTNLRQYIGMSPVNPLPLKEAGLTFLPTGHGSGMIGLPGDYSPPSRFIRLGMFIHQVNQQPDAAHNLNLCNHVINAFAIPLGIICEVSPEGKTVNKELTQWVSYRDLTNHIFYFKTYDNSTLRKIDLNNLDFSVKEVKRIPMYGTQETIIDVTK